MSISNPAFKKRKDRVRRKLRKISDRNRLSVFKSSRHIHVQIIDDLVGETLVSASSLEQEVRQNKKSNCNKQIAMQVGKMIADRAEAKSIQLVAFDKGGHKYHGVIKALADEARKKLKF